MFEFGTYMTKLQVTYMTIFIFFYLFDIYDFIVLDFFIKTQLSVAFQETFFDGVAK